RGGSDSEMARGGEPATKGGRAPAPPVQPDRTQNGGQDGCMQPHGENPCRHFLFLSASSSLWRSSLSLHGGSHCWFHSFSRGHACSRPRPKPRGGEGGRLQATPKGFR